MMKSIRATLQIAGLLAIGLGAALAASQDVSHPALSTALSVRAFGAKGDGKTDDTAAFQKALDAAAKSGGGVVHVPLGQYRMEGHLNVPAHVTLEGVFRAPTARSQNHGSTLLAVEGRGQADGAPFLFLNANATLKGLTIFYPEQDPEKPAPYPWCVRGQGDNCTVLDVLMVNPWAAVDFGTLPCGRHLVRGLYAQALHRGLKVDRCLDVGRIENVHFWPFWDTRACPATDHTRREGVAFSFGRTDWEYVTGCFCIGYQVGMEFVVGGDTNGAAGGPGNVLLSQSGADVCSTAVRVASSQSHAGISFANSQIYGDIVVEPGNAGPVRFTGCGLFGSIDGARGTALARIHGTGRVSFDHCTFACIDPANKGGHQIVAESGRLGLVNCQFLNTASSVVNPAHLLLGEKLGAAIITANEFNGPLRLDNHMRGQLVLANNLESTETDVQLLAGGGRSWCLEDIAPGSEGTDLAPGGGFEEAGDPDDAGRWRAAAGWTRTGSVFVEPTMMPVAGWKPENRVMIGRPGLGGGPVGQYYRPVTLEPDTAYVLSAYLWNLSGGGRSARVVVDLLGIKPLHIVAMPGQPGVRQGLLATMPFNSAATGTNVILRAWYDQPAGWDDSDEPVLQIDRIAITPQARFRPPTVR